MKYQKIHKYKYRLETQLVIKTSIRSQRINHKLFSLTPDGIFTIHAGYLWDGVSGPTWDTLSTMRAGLVHDALYQAIRLELLLLYFKPLVDTLFYDIMIEDKVWPFRAKYFHFAVREFGHNSCIPGDIHIPEVLEV